MRIRRIAVARASRGAVPFLGVLGLAWCLAACSGFASTSDGAAAEVGGALASIDPTLTFAQLTPAQQVNFCNLVDSAQGGYGRSVRCSDGTTQTTDASLGDCEASVATLANVCPLLVVGDVTGCAGAIGSNLCSFTTAPQCAAVRACAP